METAMGTQDKGRPPPPHVLWVLSLRNGTAVKVWKGEQKLGAHTL